MYIYIYISIYLFKYIHIYILYVSVKLVCGWVEPLTVINPNVSTRVCQSRVQHDTSYANFIFLNWAAAQPLKLPLQTWISRKITGSDLLERLQIVIQSQTHMYSQGCCRGMWSDAAATHKCKCLASKCMWVHSFQDILTYEVLLPAC